MFPILLRKNQDGAFEFADSREAYDAVQCHDEIADGDLIVIKSEGIVGLAATWPCAVTVAHGALHSKLPEMTWVGFSNMSLMPLHKIHVAINLARKLGYEVAP